MTIILKSDKELISGSLNPLLDTYIARVNADGGVIGSMQPLFDAFDFVKNNNITKNEVFSAVSPMWGYKIESGVVTKLYNLFDLSGDFDLSGGHTLNDVNNIKSIVFHGSTLELAESVGESVGNNLSIIASFKLDTGYTLKSRYLVGSENNARVGTTASGFVGMYNGASETVSGDINNKNIIRFTYLDGSAGLYVNGDNKLTIVRNDISRNAISKWYLGAFNSVSEATFVGDLYESWIMTGGQDKALLIENRLA